MHVLLQPKINVNGAEWLAQLVRQGLVSKSFLPPPAIHDLCELVRHWHTLLETRTAARNEGLSFPGTLDCEGMGRRRPEPEPYAATRSRLRAAGKTRIAGPSQAMMVA